MTVGANCALLLCKLFVLMMSLTGCMSATTTTTLLAAVCSMALPITTIVTRAPTSVGLAASGQHDGVLPPQLMMRHKMRSSVGLTTVLQQQQPPSQMPPQAYSNYAMGPPHVNVLFEAWAFHKFIVLYVGAWNSVCFLLSGSHVAAMLTSGGSDTGVCNATTLWSIPFIGICTSLVMVCGPHQEYTKWLLLPVLWLMGLHATHSVVPKPFHQYDGAYNLGAQQSPNPSAFTTW